MTTNPSPPDWRGLCEELVEALEIQLDELRFDNRLCKRARAALAAAADGPAVPEGREPASVVGEPSDEELLELWQGWNLGWDPQKGTVLMPHPAEYARAVLARWGHQPAPAVEGEVGDEARYLAKELRDQADDMSPALELFGLMHRAADLLEQRHPAPVPVAERLPELRGMFERILCVARSSGNRPVGNIELAGRLIKAVVSWAALPLPAGDVE